MKDVDKAAAKIAEVIINKRKIGIIGDYDVDGATSSSVLRLFLESVGINPIVHIPDRECRLHRQSDPFLHGCRP